ncbi:hypothetical protein BD779DRAFT_1668450 [Infundibulicybe gibba]|nr:hypothetical protein BD779DRAFT_1668450 [Infundibulicybe gibba]
MALTQSARPPGPSWDEEVVPALRKRLESESRTLSKRMSAVSLSEEGLLPTFSAFADPTTRDRSVPSPAFSHSSSSTTRPRPSTQQSESSIASSSSRVNGVNISAKKPIPPSFPRSRTYSQPFLPNGDNSGSGRLKMGGSKSHVDPARSFSPRLTDPKPTRIPKASRSPPSSHGHSPPLPHHNGYSYSSFASPSMDIERNPSNLQMVPEVPTNASQSTVYVSSRNNSGILNEPAPFKPGSMSSSVAPSYYGSAGSHDESGEALPRSSNDSGERPFEHWYRGEVSRNGGVGELRVGRRQEMLEIANYGHRIKNQKPPSIRPAANPTEYNRQHRKRADKHAREIGRVLDESPLTDLEDGEGFATTADISTISAPAPQPPYDGRSTTPTPASTHRSSSRQNGPTRIPTPSSRPSTDTTRSPTPTHSHRGASEPPPVPSSSTTTTPSTSRQQSQPTSTPTPGSKRGISPAPTSSSKKSRTAASKATQAKTLAARKQMEEEANRRSVAHYPTPAAGDDMADAIPSWTQPKLSEGNWDEVVLPVVARKKGLDNQYEQADGSPRPKKVDSAVAPAPGTFGFDHSKYRPPRPSDEVIPMDEFGRHTNRIPEELEQEPREARPHLNISTAHDDTQLPTRHSPPPSPAPFSDYAPTQKIQVPMVNGARPSTDVEMGKQEEEEKDDAGCCKCIIM